MAGGGTLHHNRLRASVARGGALGVLGAASSTTGGFLLVLLASRLLGASVAGQVFAAIALFTVVTNATKLGADTALVRYVSRLVADRQESDVPRVLRLALPTPVLLSCIIGLSLALGADRVANVLYHDTSGSGAGYIQALALFVPLATLTLLLLAVTRGFGTVAPFVTVEQIFKPLSRPVLVALAVATGGGGLLVLGAWLVPVVGGLVIAVLALGHQLRRPAPPGEMVGEPPTAGQFWRFATPRALSGILEITAPWLAVLLLSALAGAVDTAVFTAVTRVGLAGTMVIVAMRLALAPHVSAALGGGHFTFVAELHRHSTVLSILLSWPFYFLAAVFADPILSVFGSDFRSGEWALVAVAAANLLNIAVGNVQTILLMSGRSSWNLIDTGMAVATQALLAVLLIPDLGVTGAGLAYGGGILVNNVAATLQVRYGLGIAVWSPAVTRACLVTAMTFGAFAVCARLLVSDSLAALALSMSVSAPLFAWVVLRYRERFELVTGWRVLSGIGDAPRTAGGSA